jgi:hypothetical protein
MESMAITFVKCVLEVGQKHIYKHWWMIFMSKLQMYALKSIAPVMWRYILFWNLSFVFKMMWRKCVLNVYEMLQVVLYIYIYISLCKYMNINWRVFSQCLQGHKKNYGDGIHKSLIKYMHRGVSWFDRNLYTRTQRQMSITQFTYLSVNTDTRQTGLCACIHFIYMFSS